MVPLHALRTGLALARPTAATRSTRALVPRPAVTKRFRRIPDNHGILESETEFAISP